MLLIKNIAESHFNAAKIWEHKGGVRVGLVFFFLLQLKATVERVTSVVILLMTSRALRTNEDSPIKHGQRLLMPAPFSCHESNDDVTYLAASDVTSRFWNWKGRRDFHPPIAISYEINEPTRDTKIETTLKSCG